MVNKQVKMIFDQILQVIYHTIFTDIIVSLDEKAEPTILTALRVIIGYHDKRQEMGELMKPKQVDAVAHFNCSLCLFGWYVKHTHRYKEVWWDNDWRWMSYGNFSIQWKFPRHTSPLSNFQNYNFPTAKNLA